MMKLKEEIDRYVCRNLKLIKIIISLVLADCVLRTIL